MKRLFKLEQQIGKYGEKLMGTPPPSTRQNQWIVNEIRTILDKKMAAHSSKPELTQHFSELFCGLDKISKPSISAMKDPLDPRHTQTEILDAFDAKYFNGQATFDFTRRLLMDRRVVDVDHFIRAVAQGGTILRSWTAAQRDLFQLHVANKLWLLGKRDEARGKLAFEYSNTWKHQLRTGDMAWSSLDLLIRALIATKAVPLEQILEDVSGNWRSLYVVWKYSFPREIVLTLDNDYLLQALNLVAKNSESLPSCLNMIPRNRETAPQQIRSALLRHAQNVKDSKLLDLLLASSEGKDKIVEAGALAAKLALA